MEQNGNGTGVAYRTNGMDGSSNGNVFLTATVGPILEPELKI